VPTGKAAHTDSDATSMGTWGSKYLTVFILLSGVEVVVDELLNGAKVVHWAAIAALEWPWEALLFS